MAPGIRPFLEIFFSTAFQNMVIFIFSKKISIFSSSVSYVFKLLGRIDVTWRSDSFLSILSNPETVWNNQSVYRIAYFLGYRDASELVFPITLTFIFTCLLASAIRLLSIWANGKYSAFIGSDISILSYRKTLYQPFIVHIKRNSSEVINTITMQTARTTAGFTAFLQMTSSSLISLSLFVGLFVIDWKIALSAVILFSMTYSLIARFTSKSLK